MFGKSSLSTRTTGLAVFPGCRAPFVGSRTFLNSGKSSTRPRSEIAMAKAVGNVSLAPVNQGQRQFRPVLVSSLSHLCPFSGKTSLSS